MSKANSQITTEHYKMIKVKSLKSFYKKLSKKSKTETVTKSNWSPETFVQVVTCNYYFNPELDTGCSLYGFEFSGNDQYQARDLTFSTMLDHLEFL